MGERGIDRVIISAAVGFLGSISVGGIAVTAAHRDSPKPLDILITVTTTVKRMAQNNVILSLRTIEERV